MNEKVKIPSIRIGALVSASQGNNVSSVSLLNLYSENSEM